MNGTSKKNFPSCSTGNLPLVQLVSTSFDSFSCFLVQVVLFSVFLNSVLGIHKRQAKMNSLPVRSTSPSKLSEKTTNYFFVCIDFSNYWVTQRKPQSPPFPAEWRWGKDGTQENWKQKIWCLFPGVGRLPTQPTDKPADCAPSSPDIPVRETTNLSCFGAKRFSHGDVAHSSGTAMTPIIEGLRP